MRDTMWTAAGVADLQQAALAEARRFMREAKGDRRVATELVLDRVRELGWISDDERALLTKMYAADRRPQNARRSRGDATAAYLEVRGIYGDMLAGGATGPVAIALAAGVVGSYEPVDGGDGTTVVYAKSTRSYQGILGGAGAIIGGAFGGAPGAAIGGAIGGVIGTIVDDCKD